LKRILILARWEFNSKIKTRSFFIYTILFPVIVIMIGMIPSKLLSENKNKQKIGMVFFNDGLKNIVKEEINKQNLESKFSFIDYSDRNIPNNIILIETDVLLTKNEIDFLLIADVKYGKPDFELRCLKELNNFNFSEIQSMVYEASFLFISQTNNSVIFPNKLKVTQLTSKKMGDFLDSFYTAYFFIMILAITIIYSGGSFIRSLVEEKNSRIIEMILSSVKTKDILFGKILGLGILSLLQLAIWIIIFSIFYPERIIDAVTGSFFCFQILYFLLGYFLYLSIFIGCGAFVNTEQGAQQLAGYLSLFLLMPIIISVVIVQSPNSLITQILTYFPLTTAPIMLLKIVFYNPPAFEIFITYTLLLLSILFGIKFSAHIFRISMLIDKNKFSWKKILSVSNLKRSE